MGITLCLNYCQSMYNACQNITEIQNNPNITDGTSLCESFNGGEINFAIVPVSPTGECLDYTNFNNITNSGCVPWQQSSTGDDGGHNSSSSDKKLSGLEITIIILAVLVLLAIIV